MIRKAAREPFAGSPVDLQHGGLCHHRGHITSCVEPEAVATPVSTRHGRSPWLDAWAESITDLFTVGPGFFG
jgi:hypothetical protein